MRHIPNIISVIRILLIPFFIQFMLTEQYLPAGIVLVASGLTDALDGFLARRFHWVSQLGKVLDPVADKLTQVSLYLTIGFVIGKTYRWIWWFFAIMLCKELIMIVLGADLLKKGVKIEGAKWTGKVNTVLFYVTMAILVFFPQAPKALIAFLLTACTCATLCALLSYLPEYRRYRQESAKKDA